jgi:hypothetical protein
MVSPHQYRINRASKNIIPAANHASMNPLMGHIVLLDDFLIQMPAIEKLLCLY